MPLVQLIYMSTALVSDEATMRTIVASAQRRNTRSGVTGMLLICDSNVLQVLEGEQSAVEDTFDRIRLDTRHTRIHKFHELHVIARDFGEWSMGYRRLSGTDFTSMFDHGDPFKLTPAEIANRVKPGLAQRLLRSM